MTNETKAENMLLDKKWTRKRLIDEVLKLHVDKVDLFAKRRKMASDMSVIIGDRKYTQGYNSDECKQYNLAEAIERAFELIIEARKVPELESTVVRLDTECDNMRRLLDTTIEERTRAQEAVALVGATFNDYRTANAVDKMVEIGTYLDGEPFGSIDRRPI